MEEHWIPISTHSAKLIELLNDKQKAELLTYLCYLVSRPINECEHHKDTLIDVISEVMLDRKKIMQSEMF